jgi:hypothetical protein
MAFHNANKKSSLPVWFWLQMLIFLAFIACSSEEKIEPQRQENSGGFTFFDVHHDTIYAKSLRERLVGTLSSDAIEYRSIINLEIVAEGFLQQHFPQLDELNRRLNYPAGERVEHPTIKLMYRWATRKNLPFSYVEFLFSQESRKPLYVKIESARNIDDIVDSLSGKYGPSTILQLDSGRGEIRYWENNRDVFLVARLLRRNRHPLYRMMIYYADNLEEFILGQEKLREMIEEKQQREGRSAF